MGPAGEYGRPALRSSSCPRILWAALSRFRPAARPLAAGLRAISDRIVVIGAPPNLSRFGGLGDLIGLYLRFISAIKSVSLPPRGRVAALPAALPVPTRCEVCEPAALLGLLCRPGAAA